MNHRYTVILERQPAGAVGGGGYHAFCPALPGCHSEGDTLDATVANIQEAMSLYLESLAAHHEPAPLEDILIKPVEVVVGA